jgi:hypothetical protein
VEYVIRFSAGGLLVSAFAVLGDILRPKSFAGLFGAAPSVALATVGLALWTHGGDYVALEGRSMILGALAFGVYSLAVCQLMMRANWSTVAASTMGLILWLAAAVGSKHFLIG